MMKIIMSSSPSQIQLKVNQSLLFFFILLTLLLLFQIFPLAEHSSQG